MIEKIDLKTFKITSNHVLIKADASHDFMEIPGPNGTVVALKHQYYHEDRAKHFAITGTVLAVPQDLFFFDNKEKYYHTPYSEFNSRMVASLPFVGNVGVQVGEDVYFNFKGQLDAEQECRLLLTETHGFCLLVRYELLFGVVKGNKLHPLNGWVFFKRKKEDKKQGVVVAADAYVPRYMDDPQESDTELNIGDEIIVDPKWGYPIAYEMHNLEIKDVEVVQRRHILAKIDNNALLPVA